MAINDNFLSAITDAMLHRLDEPGKLDEVANQINHVVQGLGKSAQAIDKMSSRMLLTVREAAKIVNLAERKKLDAGQMLNAPELTRIVNKVLEPLHHELAALRQDNNKLSRAFSNQFLTDRNNDRDMKNQFTRLQQRLESRATRTVSAAIQPHEGSSFQAQLARAFAEVVSLRHLATKTEQTQAQQMLTMFRQEALSLRKDLLRQLAEAERANYPHVGPGRTAIGPAGRMYYDSGYRQVESRGLGEAGTDLYTKLALAGVYGGITARGMHPAHSTDYGIKKGAGATPDPTPGYLGAASIPIDRRMGQINEFLRSTKKALTNPLLAQGAVTDYTQQRSWQEQIQRSRGRTLQTHETVRSGEELVIASMAGYNKVLRNRADAEREFGGLDQSELRKTAQRNRAIVAQQRSPARLARIAAIEVMVGQPWAQSSKKFEPSEIKSFVKQYGRNVPADPSIIKTAFQMANQVGQKTGKWHELGSIGLRGQKAVLNSRVEAQRAEVRRIAGLLGPSTQTKGSFNRLQDEIDKLSGKKSGEKGSIDPGMLDPRWLGEGVKKAWQGFRSKFAGAKAGQDQTERILYNRAGNFEDIPKPAFGTKQSMQYDALMSKLRKFGEAVDASRKSLEHYEKTVGPQKRAELEDRFGFRRASIMGADESSKAGFEAQEKILGIRRGQAAARFTTQKAHLEEVEASGKATAAERYVSAQDAYAEAFERQGILKGKLRGSKVSASDQQRMISAVTRPKEIRLARAEYDYKSSTLTDPQALADLRASTTSRIMELRYPGGKGSATARQEYAQHVLESLGGSTLAQKTASRTEEAIGEVSSKRGIFDVQSAALETKKRLAGEKTSALLVKNEKERVGAVAKLEDWLAQKKTALTNKVASIQKSAFEQRVKYLKGESVAGGGGGGGGGRGGGMFGGSARGGYGFGMGLMGLVAYDEALKSLVKDMAVYAARTQTMEFATNQMAKVSGLNVQEVNAEVEAIKKLNVTTQAAHQTVQRMMMMQLNLADATKLVSVAQDLAAISGADAMETISRLSAAVLTGYTRNLHMMGLQVTSIGVMRELKAQRRTEGKTGEPSVAEQRQALTNRIILEGAKIAGTYERSLSTAGGQFAYLRKEIQETENVLGKQFLPTFASTVMAMTSGLHVVQEHAEGFAELTKVLVSLGVAASALGTIGFLKTIIGSSGMGPYGAVAGLVIAGGTLMAANAVDPADTIKDTAKIQKEMIAKRIVDLKEQKKLLEQESDQTSPDHKHAYSTVLAQLKAYGESQVSIEKETTASLAEEYTKRLKGLDDFAAGMEGRQGFWGRISARFSGNRDISMRDYLVTGAVGGSYDDLAEEQKAGLARKLTAGTNVKPEEIKAEAERQAREAKVVPLDKPIINAINRHAENLVSSYQLALENEEKFSKIVAPLGKFALKAQKAMGSPREKAQLDYHVMMEQRETFFRDMNKAKADAEKFDDILAKGGVPTQVDLTNKKTYDAMLKKIGGGDVEEGGRKFDEAWINKDAVDSQAKSDLSIEMGKFDAHTAAAIVKIKEQGEVEKIRAATVLGNYESERKEVDLVFSAKQKNAAKVLALTHDEDAYKQQVAENEVERANRILELKKKGVQTLRDVMMSRASFTSERRVRDIEKDPMLTSEEAIEAAYQERLKAAKKLPYGDSARKIEELDQGKVEASDELADERVRTGAEGRISEYQDQQELMSQIDRITSSKGRSEHERNLDEIKRTRDREVAEAANRFNERLRPEYVPKGSNMGLYSAGLLQDKDAAVRQANVKEAADTVKEREQQREKAKELLSETYQRQVQQSERTHQLQATNAADERTATYNDYKMKLAFIEKEFAKRGESQDTLAAKARKTQEAEFEYATKLLEERKQQIEGLRNVAGGFFDILTSRGTDKSKQFREFFTEIPRGIGKKMFQNFAVEEFGKYPGKLGGIFGKQEEDVLDANGKPTGKKKSTLMGRILAGTPFAKSDAGTAQEHLTKATEASVDAEKRLEDAIKSLDDAVRQADGLVPRKETVTSTMGSGASASRLPWVLPPLITGSLGQQDPWTPARFLQLTTGTSGGMANAGSGLAMPFLGAALSPALSPSGVAPGGTTSGLTFNNVNQIMAGLARAMAPTGVAPKKKGLNTGPLSVDSGVSKALGPLMSKGGFDFNLFGTKIGSKQLADIAGGLFGVYQGVRQGHVPGAIEAVGGGLLAASPFAGPVAGPPMALAGTMAMLASSMFPSSGDVIAADIEKKQTLAEFSANFANKVPSADLSLSTRGPGIPGAGLLGAYGTEGGGIGEYLYNLTKVTGQNFHVEGTPDWTATPGQSYLFQAPDDKYSLIGGPNSQFLQGGSGKAGATLMQEAPTGQLPSTPVALPPQGHERPFELHMNITAFDHKSIIDHAPEIADAVHRAIITQGHPLAQSIRDIARTSSS